MRRIGLAALMVALAVVPRGVLTAQTAPDEAIVIAGAVTHLMHVLRTNDGVPPGTIGYDPRIVERRELVHPAYSAPVSTYALADRHSELAAAARQVLGAAIGDLETARVCTTGSLRSCSLRDAVAVFATSLPSVRGDSADVVVKALWLSNLKKQPVQGGTFLMTLLREPGGWRVVRSRTLTIS